MTNTANSAEAIAVPEPGAPTSPDRSVSDDALASGGPAGDGGFDWTKPSTTLSGEPVILTHIVGRIIGTGETRWTLTGTSVHGDRENDLINTPIPTVPPTPAGDMAGEDDAAFLKRIDTAKGWTENKLPDHNRVIALARRAVEAEAQVRQLSVALTIAVQERDDAREGARREPSVAKPNGCTCGWAPKWIVSNVPGWPRICANCGQSEIVARREPVAGDGISDYDLAQAISDLLGYFRGSGDLPNSAAILLRAAREHLRRRPLPAAPGTNACATPPSTTPVTPLEEAMCRTFMRLEGRAAYADRTGDFYDCGLDKSLPAWRAKLWTAREILAAQPSEASFQARVQPWMMACFGETISSDREERNHRFLEEALELVQSTGCTASEAHQLVDYVYGRPDGEPAQEVGGVMVTLAALCLANDLEMHTAAETELARIWTKVDKIRAKHAAKPKHSPLPEHALPSAASPEPTQRDYITRDRDMILEAINSYDGWLSDDDFDAGRALKGIMERMRYRAKMCGLSGSLDENSANDEPDLDICGYGWTEREMAVRAPDGAGSGSEPVATEAQPVDPRSVFSVEETGDCEYPYAARDAVGARVAVFCNRALAARFADPPASVDAVAVVTEWWKAQSFKANTASFACGCSHAVQEIIAALRARQQATEARS